MIATPRAMFSLTNLGPLPAGRLRALAMVDFDTRKVSAISPAHRLIREHFGAMGTVRWGEGYVLLIQSVPTQAIIMDSEWEIVDVVDLPLVTDPHSLVISDGAWYVLSTGSDSVVAVEPNTGRQSVVWEAPSGGVDLLHLNSIFVLNDDLCVSAMCRRDGSLASSTDGIVLNLHTGQTLMRPLFHPHSARVIEGEVVLCESGRRRVISSGGSVLSVPLGYVRGFDVTDRHIVIGTSRSRRPPVGRCTIQLYERTSSEIGGAERVASVHVGDLGPEIFDVLAM